MDEAMESAKEVIGMKLAYCRNMTNRKREQTTNQIMDKIRQNLEGRGLMPKHGSTDINNLDEASGSRQPLTTVISETVKRRNGKKHLVKIVSILPNRIDDKKDITEEMISCIEDNINKITKQDEKKPETDEENKSKYDLTPQEAYKKVQDYMEEKKQKMSSLTSDEILPEQKIPDNQQEDLDLRTKLREFEEQEEKIKKLLESSDSENEDF